MTVRRKTNLIRLTTAVIALTSAVVIVGGFMVAVEIEAPASTQGAGATGVRPTVAEQVSSDVPQVPGLDHLVRLCERDLRAPLFDAPTPVAVETVEPAAPAPTSTGLSVKLLGTIIEPGHSMAMLQKSDGSVALIEAGQSIDDGGAKVVVAVVELRRVVIRIGNESHELVLPPPTAEGKP